MDPDKNLEEQLELANRLVEDTRPPAETMHDVERLAELVISLDAWIRRGGFLPSAWARP